MSIFNRKAKPKPVVRVGELRLEYSGDDDFWNFERRGVDFSFYGNELTLPTEDQFRVMEGEMARLKPAMLAAIAESWTARGTPAAAKDEVECIGVDITDFAKEGTYSVSWGGGELWGDFGVDFTIKSGQIIAEDWGD